MVRDERHGGYGDTSAIPSLAPVQERGAAAVAALTAVLEVQREVALEEAAALAPAEPAPQPPLTEQPAPEPAPQPDPPAAVTKEPAAVANESEWMPPPGPDTPAADTGGYDVAELGLADKLGLGKTDRDDEVGPTS
jgi:cell division transport system ATP-binding protein